MNRGRSSGGGVMRKSVSSQRKQCPRGTTCPYIDEYQHSLEFSHESVLPLSQDRINKKRSFDAFSGSGHRLGVSDTSGLWEDVERTHARRFHGRTIATSTGADMKYLDQFFLCDVCGEHQPIEGLEEHLAQHQNSKGHYPVGKDWPMDKSGSGNTSSNGRFNHGDGSRSSIRSEQDEAYELSVIEELKRKTLEEEEARQRLEQERMSEEKRSLQAAAIVSLREQAQQALQAEPTPSSYSGKIISIRFTCPSGNKILRKFRAENILQEVYWFLLTQDELQGKLFALKGIRDEISFDEIRRQGFCPNNYDCGAESITENSAFTVLILDKPEDLLTEEVTVTPRAVEHPGHSVETDHSHPFADDTSRGSIQVPSKDIKVVDLLDSVEKKPPRTMTANNTAQKPILVDLT